MPFSRTIINFSKNDPACRFHYKDRIMKWLSRIIALVLFIFFFVLALKNTQETALYFFWGYELRGPLVLIVLCFFIAGCILGLLAMMPMIFRNRRDLTRQRKKIEEMELAKKASEKAGAPSTQAVSDTNID